MKSEIQRLIGSNRLADAKKLCKTLCINDRKDAEAWFLLGSICAQTGDIDEAIKCLKKSLAINSRSARTHNNLGLVYLYSNRLREAGNSFEQALRIEPDSIEILFNLGAVFRATQQLDKAEDIYRKILEINPVLTGVLNNLGITLLEKGEPSEAERYLLKSREIDPGQESTYRNLANTYREQRRVADAEKALRQALALQPGLPQIHWDLSLVLLELGNFREGWEEYEWRLKGGGTAIREFPVPAWDGGDISDSTILVTAEQGIGDEIMFSSCYPDLISHARRVIIDCENRLAQLFRRSFPAAIVHASHQSEDISWLEKIPSPDVHISAGSLPRFFRGSAGDFPAHSGYLIADNEKIEKWQCRYRGLDRNHTVGISWKGGHVSQAARRSTSIEDWADLLSIPQLNFVSLQYGETSADIQKAAELTGTVIHQWRDCDPLRDMDEFAAQISALDLVISVDNSTVHLGGALGTPVWVLQPYCPDWRWMQQSDTSYWYPSVRQFHLPSTGEWKQLIDIAARELEACISAGYFIRHGKH